MTPDRQLEWLRATWLLRAVRRETHSKPLQAEWEMSCVVHWGDARLKITPTIHNILVLFLCQLRDKQQHDYKGNNKPTVWNACPTTQLAVFRDIKVRFTAQFFKSYMEPLRRNKRGSNVFPRNWNGKVILGIFYYKLPKILQVNTKRICIAKPSDLVQAWTCLTVLCKLYLQTYSKTATTTWCLLLG